jgi:diguanylate cyclase (GGDEF)-like protein
MLVDDVIAGLHEGEKGILFLLAIHDFAKTRRDIGDRNLDNYMQSTMNALLADFRSKDIIRRIDTDRFVVFICGTLSIDVIEKRAQRIMDFFLRVNMRDAQIAGAGKVSCSMGVAVGSQHTDYHQLQAQADEALEHAWNNHFRMYGDWKY